ncbi:solute carrier family 49 member 4 homolog [Watersipora subatra]|uniref:solute carrier family 49 member 4 homolog n=1 Tax=Watersipora subatra TaxID=2589382 RepID=UPI00355B10DA
MSSNGTEKTALLDSTQDKIKLYASDESPCSDDSATEKLQPKVYPVRWWTLFIFSFCIATQSLCWVIWPPLSNALLIAHGWDVSAIGMANAATSVTFLILSLPVMYIVETKGIRVGVLVAYSALTVACILWNISLFTQLFWVFAVGSFINGIAPCVTVAVPALFSVTWFPVYQRTTATSICILSISVGSVVAYTAGPLIIGCRITSEAVLFRDNLTDTHIDEIVDGIQNVGYFVLGASVLGLILTIAHFPAAPPTPPSIAQTVKREDFIVGLKKLKNNYQYWILFVLFNLKDSTVFAWFPLIAVHFRGLGLDETTASWICTVATIAAAIGVFIIAILADHHYFKRKTKLILKWFTVASIVLLLILVLIQDKYIPVSEGVLVPVLYILLIGIAVSTQSIFPICAELACEYAYPVYEGLTCTILLIGSYMIGIVFYCLLFVPKLADDTGWMTWQCLFGSIIAMPLLFLLKDDFRRLNLDDKPDTLNKS